MHDFIWASKTVQQNLHYRFDIHHEMSTNRMNLFREHHYNAGTNVSLIWVLFRSSMWMNADAASYAGGGSKTLFAAWKAIRIALAVLAAFAVVFPCERTHQNH